jgi:Flp pilus assembly protein TadG
VLGLRTRFACERGQMFALTAVVAVAIVAMGAFVLDVGAWFRGHRATQAAADAAALAGAQALPGDTAGARALALDYAGKNGGGVEISDIQFASNTFANDTITVTARRSGASFLAKVLGLGRVDLVAHAQARAFNMGEALYAAPFAVERDHPYLSQCGGPCYGSSYPTTLDIYKTGPGNFKLVDLDGSDGNTGTSTLASWVERGYDQYMDLGWYHGDDGTKFNSGQMRQALDGRRGSDLLLPVYDQAQGQGQGFIYRVVGWAVFHMTDYSMKGSCNKESFCTISGYFVTTVWNGIGTPSADNYFGARVVKLVG